MFAYDCRSSRKREPEHALGAGLLECVEGGSDRVAEGRLGVVVADARRSTVGREADRGEEVDERERARALVGAALLHEPPADRELRVEVDPAASGSSARRARTGSPAAIESPMNVTRGFGVAAVADCPATAAATTAASRRRSALRAVRPARPAGRTAPPPCRPRARA